MVVQYSKKGSQLLTPDRIWWCVYTDGGAFTRIGAAFTGIGAVFTRIGAVFTRIGAVFTRIDELFTLSISIDFAVRINITSP